uniref:Uncharacterized protein n=1 Tax=viral metagenome TaxID=1070528 RepID=A0A6H1ZRZ9_9ZZZZ
MTNWTEYRSRNYLTVDLADIGLKGCWVKIRKAGSYTLQEMSSGEAKWINERKDYLVKKIMSVLTDVEEADALKMVESMDRGLPDARLAEIIANGGVFWANQVLSGMDIEMIEDWNLTDPETDAPLPTPKQDFSSLEKLPQDILWMLKEKLMEVQRDVVPPKVREMASLRLS